jgi:hypothetical protein
MPLGLGFVVAAFGLAGIVAWLTGVHFRVTFVQVSGAVLIAAATYYQIDTIGQAPVRALFETLVNGLIFAAGLVGIAGGSDGCGRSPSSGSSCTAYGTCCTSYTSYRCSRRRSTPGCP